MKNLFCGSDSSALLTLNFCCHLCQPGLDWGRACHWPLIMKWLSVLWMFFNFGKCISFALFTQYMRQVVVSSIVKTSMIFFFLMKQVTFQEIGSHQKSSSYTLCIRQNRSLNMQPSRNSHPPGNKGPIVRRYIYNYANGRHKWANMEPDHFRASHLWHDPDSPMYLHGAFTLLDHVRWFGCSAIDIPKVSQGLFSHVIPSSQMCGRWRRPWHIHGCGMCGAPGRTHGHNHRRKEVQLVAERRVTVRAEARGTPPSLLALPCSLLGLDARVQHLPLPAGGSLSLRFWFAWWLVRETGSASGFTVLGRRRGFQTGFDTVSECRCMAGSESGLWTEASWLLVPDRSGARSNGSEYGWSNALSCRCTCAGTTHPRCSRARERPWGRPWSSCSSRPTTKSSSPAMSCLRTLRELLLGYLGAPTDQFFISCWVSWHLEVSLCQDNKGKPYQQVYTHWRPRQQRRKVLLSGVFHYPCWPVD